VKPRELLNRIRGSKSWTEKLALVKDQVPGTNFDWLIPPLIGALHALEDHPESKSSYMLPNGQIDLEGLHKDTLAAFGKDLARAIQEGNSKLFREWAIAIDAWHTHKPM